MGTPPFAVKVLEEIHHSNHQLVGVATSIDKPAGRGNKINQSAVKIFSLKHQLNLLQPEKLKDENVDFIVYDYLAEITMSIMARARAKNPDTGYALDFVSAAMKPNLKEIARQGVRIVSNAGGVNPQACANALRVVIAELGLNLTVACILGDDMISQRDKVAAHGYKEMFSGDDFPDCPRGDCRNIIKTYTKPNKFTENNPYMI